MVKALGQVANASDGTFVRAIDSDHILVRRADGPVGVFTLSAGTLMELAGWSCPTFDAHTVATGGGCAAWPGPRGCDAVVADLNGTTPRVVSLAGTDEAGGRKGDRGRRRRRRQCNIGISEDGSLVWVVNRFEAKVYRRDSSALVCRRDLLPLGFGRAPNAIGVTASGRQGVVLWSADRLVFLWMFQAQMTLSAGDSHPPELILEGQVTLPRSPGGAPALLQQLYLKPRLTDLEEPAVFGVTAAGVRCYSLPDLVLRREVPLSGVQQLCLTPTWLAVLDPGRVRVMDYGFQLLNERLYSAATHILNQLSCPPDGQFLLISLKTRSPNGQMVLMRPALPQPATLRGPSDVPLAAARTTVADMPFVKAPSGTWTGWHVAGTPPAKRRPTSAGATASAASAAPASAAPAAAR